MNNDEIVSNIITLIHSTTKSNYVTCSQVSAKIFSYLSEIQLKDNQWKDLNQAIERFDQSIDHPDLCHCRQLIETISTCSNDDEERNYTLGRDKNKLIDCIHQLRDLLQAHVNLHCFLLVKLIEQQDIRLKLISLMNLTGMNVGNQLHGILCDIVHFLCQIDPTFTTSTVIDHPIVLNGIRMIQTNDNARSAVISALRLLTDLLITNETFPVHTYSQLSNYVFLKSVLELIENNPKDDELISIAIKLLLSFNLRFDYPHENPIMLTLLAVNDKVSCRELIERLILLFNRSVDPVEAKSTNSVIKFFSDIFGVQDTTTDILLSDSDRRLIIEIISRELSNRSCKDETTTAYLSLVELILRNQSITSETCTRTVELQTCFHLYLHSEDCSDENRFIIHEIFRQHGWLQLNDTSFYT